MAKIVKAEFDGSPMQFNDDGWFNATAAAERFGKRPVDWIRLNETNDYMCAVSERLKCEPESLLNTRKGNAGGTWLHPALAVAFARWLDVRFAVWCAQQIKAIIYGTPEQNITNPVQCIVMRNPPKLGIGTLCRLMDDCLPEEIETEADMQKLIDKLWPALVCEFEIDT